MKSPLRFAIGSAVLLSIVACAPPTVASGTPAATPAPVADPPSAPSGAANAAPVSIYAGVYTAAQADRGDAVQQRNCRACHTPGDWSGGRILSAWSGRSALELIEFLQSSMPMDSPGSLSQQEYTDVVAYMLELNAIPAGDVELGPDEDQTRQVLLEYRR